MRTGRANTMNDGLAALVPGLSDLWAETLGDPAVRIAVLDGPVDLTHPCFEGADLTTLATLVPGVASSGLATRHGTSVASVLFGSHGGPIAGVAPRCKGLVAPTFGEGPDGEIRPSSQTDLARAITQAVSDGARIINISGGELVDSAEMDWPLGNALKAAADEGVLVIAAAGNEGCDCIHLPAAAPTTLVVGAMNADGLPSAFSNYGQDYRSHGILAPGEGIPAAVPGGGVEPRRGTSYAVPIVSGVAALLMSRELQRGRELRAGEIFNLLLESAVTCEARPAPDCARLFRGRLNVPGAIQMLDARANKTMVDVGTTVEAGRANHDGAVAPSGMAARGAPLSLPRQEPPIMSSANAIAAMTPAVAPAGLTGDTEAPPEVPAPAAPALAAPAGAVLPSGVSADSPAEAGAAAPATSSDGAQEASAPPGVEPSGASPDAASGGVVPSDCGCKSGAGPLVFALGTLGFDFGTEALRDVFNRNYVEQTNDPTKLIYTNTDLYNYLSLNANSNVPDAASIIWTLSIDSYPVYAIQPSGPYAFEAFLRLIAVLGDTAVERIAIPGWVRGATVTLFGGQVVPVIEPDIAGMSSWSTDALVSFLLTDPSVKPSPPAGMSLVLLRRTLMNFFTRMYYEKRNVGRSPQERALNFSVTNAYAAYQILIQAMGMGLELLSVETEKSPLCRPESDCWDMKLHFFDPLQKDRLARQIFRFTVDVSDVEPVQIGNTRTWQVH